MKRLLFLTIALIVYGSLYPWHFEWWRSSETPLDVLLRSWPVVIDRFLLRDVAINILIYVPLGLTAFLTLARRHSRAFAVASSVLLGVALSGSMEILQLYVPGRVTSLLDITTNTLGTAIGALAGLLLQRRIQELTAKPAALLAPGAALLLLCWGTFLAYPFFPALSHSKLRYSLAAFHAAFPLSPSEVWANGAEWFAAALAAAAILGRLRWWWPAAAMCLVLARMLIATRLVTPNEVAGVALAAVLWFIVPARAGLRIGVCTLGLALLLRELAPFHFSTRAQSFSWIPFVPTFDSERQSAVVILARKAFDYGAMAWLLRTNGIGYWKGGGAVAAALMVLELLQIYLPGRTPEITDAVLTLLMVWGLKKIDR